MTDRVKTPCIGVCSTGIGDSVCRGCKRFAHEVIHWNGYDNTQQQAIVERLSLLLSQVVEARLCVVDSAVLKQALIEHRVRVNSGATAYCLAYEAIRQFGSQLPGLDAIGCRWRPEWVGRTIEELKLSIDEDFYRLSCAHYQRYFPGGL